MKKEVSILELKRLLHEMKDRSQVCIRYRKMGQMWELSFMKIAALTENGLILHTEEGDFKLVEDLSAIIQFEIDQSFLGFQPHSHYGVKLAEVL